MFFNIIFIANCNCCCAFPVFNRVSLEALWQVAVAVLWGMMCVWLNCLKINGV